MLGNVGLDELLQHDRHVSALGRRCGLKSVVEADFDVDIHSF
jgi:hypothetical protein